jgi:DnaJ-class molecular chaperone
MGARKALIIASDHYEQEDLPDLASPAADAAALSKVLGDPGIGDFTVQVAQDEPSHQIAARIEDMLADCRKDDLLLIHFSGHGLKKPSGELYFAARNTRGNRLDSTAVSADFLQRCLRDSPARQVVLFLDCCYSGAFPSGVVGRAVEIDPLESFPAQRLGRERSRAVITASGSVQLALEPDPERSDGPPRPSFFTAAVVEGLATGKADRNEDGWITIDELYEYVLERVQDLAPGQTPRLQVDTGGVFYLARSQRRRAKQADLPADLRAAVTDPNPYTRRGAISELSTWLASDNLPAALGAYEALTEVVRTDIEYVASFAAAALLDAAVRPSENALHFGRVTRDDLPLRRTIQLLGPPIARKCAVVPSAEWIRVERRADDLTVTVDTVRSGPLRGRVTLNGPTGEAAIEVDLELVDLAPKTPPGKQESGSIPTSGRSGSSAEQDGLLGRIFRSRTAPSSATPPRRGADVETESTLSFGDAIDGVTVSIRLVGEGPCPVCGGTGAKTGTVPKVCPDCRGTGQQARNLGGFGLSEPCATCHGRGLVVTDPCTMCQGSGRAMSPRSIQVRIPAGVMEGQRIRIPGKGARGERGGADGDLYIRIRVTPHPVFGRSGDNLTVTVPVSIGEAGAGAEIKVPTHRGPPVTVRIPPGTQNGQVFRVPGRGVRKRDGTQGALMVAVEVVVPQELSEKAKAALSDLRGVVPSAEATRAALIAQAG